MIAARSIRRACRHPVGAYGHAGSGRNAARPRAGTRARASRGGVDDRPSRRDAGVHVRSRESRFILAGCAGRVGDDRPGRNSHIRPAAAIAATRSSLALALRAAERTSPSGSPSRRAAERGRPRCSPSRRRPDARADRGRPSGRPRAPTGPSAPACRKDRCSPGGHAGRRRRTRRAAASQGG